MSKSRSVQESYFLIHYRDPKDGQIVALKAQRIQDSSLGLGFVRVADFFFETEGMVVQPTEVQLQKRFENVASLHLSIYSIVSVEEIGLKAKPLKFKRAKSNVIAFPGDTPSPKN